MLERLQRRLHLVDGEPGELVVQGESIARLYWNKPEKTASAWTTFQDAVSLARNRREAERLQIEIGRAHV